MGRTTMGRRNVVSRRYRARAICSALRLIRRKPCPYTTRETILTFDCYAGDAAVVRSVECVCQAQHSNQWHELRSPLRAESHKRGVAGHGQIAAMITNQHRDAAHFFFDSSPAEASVWRPCDIRVSGVCRYRHPLFLLCPTSCKMAAASRIRRCSAPRGKDLAL